MFLCITVVSKPFTSDKSRNHPKKVLTIRKILTSPTVVFWGNGRSAGRSGGWSAAVGRAVGRAVDGGRPGGRRWSAGRSAAAGAGKLS